MRLALLVLLSAVTSVALGDSATLSWANPTTYTDGTLLDKLIAQTVLQCSGLTVNGVRGACALTPVIVIGTSTSYVWNFTAPASAYSICFQAKTVLVDATESSWSAESCKTTKKPNSPKLSSK